MSTGGMQPTRNQHALQPFNDGQNMIKSVKGMPSCCCGWGKECKQIQMEIECLPDGTEFELWKQPYAQIVTGSTTKKQKFEEVI